MIKADHGDLIVRRKRDPLEIAREHNLKSSSTITLRSPTSKVPGAVVLNLLNLASSLETNIEEPSGRIS